VEAGLTETAEGKPNFGWGPFFGHGSTIQNAHALLRLARYKVPRKVEFVSELPRLPSAKVNKVELRRVYGEGSK
jgi:acyl-CoA synthetase (AMP-forming)/AMP-acid ligase II